MPVAAQRIRTSMNTDSHVMPALQQDPPARLEALLTGASNQDA
jgi:hypothetical protein